MKRKVIVFCFVMFTMLFLTGCGKASVTSELKFNSDGSGSRSVYATISAADAESIEGGVGGLDTLLQEAAPEGVTIRRSDADSGDSIYQFTFFFDNIEQYNEKIKQITGKDHNATWYTNNSVFLSNIEFTEDDCTTDLIGWAVDAIKEKLGGWASKNLNYELKKNEVYYNDTLEFSGTGNPQFVVQTAPKVTKVSVYTTYAFNGERTKKLKMQFEKGGLDRINLTDAKALLDQYSTKYTLDRANDVITYELKNEEIDTFLAAVDTNYQPVNNTFTIVKNPFQEKYEITESYSLSPFLSLFDMTDSPYIYDYVKVPAVMNDAEVSYTNSMGNVKVEDGYDYAGGYRYEETYHASIQADRRIDLKDIEVSYLISKDLTARREVTVTYIKNECQISKEEIQEYYKDYNENVQVSDDGKTIKVTFINTRKQGQREEGDLDYLSSYQSSRGIKYAHYVTEDQLDISRYLPEIEGYTWNRDNMQYNYTVKVAKEASVSRLQLGNLTLTGKEELDTALKDGYYELTGSFEGNQNLELTVQCSKMYDLFYMFVILAVFLFIAAGLVVALYFLKKKKMIDLEDYDDLDHL